MNSKLALLLYITALSAITYWAYPIVTERYFSEEKTQTEENVSPKLCDDGTVCEIKIPNNSSDDNSSNEENSAKEDETTPSEESLPQKSLIEITDKDCDNECEFYKNDEKNYCLEVCGLKSVPEESNDECDNMNGLEKDYCLKSQAIEKTDFSICRRIEDKSIRETCQNRVTEDIIDNQ